MNLFGICWLLVTSPVWAEETVKIIAKVNNQVITCKDLDDYSQAVQYHSGELEPGILPESPEFRKEILQRLIEDKLILDEAKKEKIDIPLRVVDERLNQIIAMHPSHTAFEESLLQRGFTITMFKERIKDQYLVREIIQNKVKSLVNVRPQEVSAYYAENMAQMYVPSVYIFYLAIAADKGHLVEIAKTIESMGLDEAINTYPQDLIRIELAQDELKPEVAAVVIRLEKTDIEIVKIDESYYLIYLDQIIEPVLLSLPEVQEKIYTYLWDKKFEERFAEWLKGLKDKAVIKIYEQ